LKGGEADLKTVGKMILMDWQRGEIPYFTLPTKEEGASKEKMDEEHKDENIMVLEKMNEELISKHLTIPLVKDVEDEEGTENEKSKEIVQENKEEPKKKINKSKGQTEVKPRQASLPPPSKK